MSTVRIALSTIDEAAKRCGLALVGVVAAEQAETELEHQRSFVDNWQQLGYAGEMGFMLRSPDLFSSLRHLGREIHSIVSFAIPYENEPPNRLKREPGFGRVARYAWGRDYHHILRARLNIFVEEIARRSEHGNAIVWRGFSDAVPLLERPLGALAKLGFIGKNSLLIRPKVGSYFFLAEILWNVEISADFVDGNELFKQAENSARQSDIAAALDPGALCRSCVRCLADCPTKAIIAPGIIDSRRCVSYLTIEKKGELAPWEREAVGEWVFGCDVCQEVCPFNHGAQFGQRNQNGVDPEFSRAEGVGPFLNLVELLGVRSDAEFKARFGRSALMRAKRDGLLRNACCVIANTRYFPAIARLGEVFREDPSELIRNHARYCLADLALDATGLDRLRVMQQLGVSGITEA